MESTKNAAGRLPVTLSLALCFPRSVLWLTGLITVVLVALASVPSIRPDLAPFLQPLRVDTDPENMLPEDEPTRVFHREMKRRFTLHDLLVVGVTNDSHPEGVFNQATLTNIHLLVEYARGLQWPAAEGRVRPDGVIAAEVLAPSTVDNIEPGETGSVRFAWLMPRPPANAEEARVVRDRLLRLPMLRGTLVSTDAKALTLLLPLTAKDVSYRVYGELQRKIAKLDGNESYHITGLPVAEDAFGVEMFIQMAISAPLAMLVVFLLMWLFFRRLILVTSAMLVALASVLITMGLLVISGHTVHIMSSMIPIFIMPIAVLDSVHILSQFFDRYGAIGDRRATIVEVVESLYKPMLYTSLTTAVGFASLALAPIPPVQVFGLFVAFGVMLAWLLTMMFIPAYVLRLNERHLQGYVSVSAASPNSLTGTFLARMGESSWRYSKPIVALGLVTLAVAVLGIGRIQVNDNPIRWFSAEHEIRAADRVLNERFGGSYMAYLALSAQEQDPLVYLDGLRDRTVRHKSELNWRPGQRLVFNRLIDQMDALTWDQLPRTDVLRRLENFVHVGLENSRPEARELWEELQLFLAQEEALAQVFKHPDVLRYLAGLQNHLHTLGTVGNTNSLADVVKTVYRELMGGTEDALRIPDSRRAVGQTLLVYQNSHRPDDLWHFVTPDYRQACLWVQLKSGDNQDMSRVVAAVEDYMGRNPPPMGLEPRWFGLSYINLVWQEHMVKGMLEAFLSSYGIVFLMMLVLLRSGIWAMMAMLPLTLTLGFIYGLIGLFGIDYDMPIAVLSALALGLAVDFAIHFLVKAREHGEWHGSWHAASATVFGLPARAITRNGLVVSIGFLPLLLAPLVPYQTVGVLIAAILLLSGGVTLVLLPALLHLLGKRLFEREQECSQCDFIACFITSCTLAVIVLLNLWQFSGLSWGTLGWLGLGLLLLAGAFCRLLRMNERLARRLQGRN